MKNENQNCQSTQGEIQAAQFNMDTFSERLREVMKRDGITQQQLAEKLGSKRQTISQYVSGTIQPNIGKLFEIAEIFKVSADYLLGLQKDIKSPNLEIQAIHNKTGLSEKAIANLIEANWRENDPNLTAFDNELDAYIVEKFLEFCNYMLEEFDVELVMGIIRYCNISMSFAKANRVKGKLIEFMQETFDDEMLKGSFPSISIDDGELCIALKPEEAKFALLGNIAEEFKAFIVKYADYRIDKHNALYAKSTKSNSDTSDDE